jgi:glucose/arabinose dehydrogenase
LRARRLLALLTSCVAFAAGAASAAVPLVVQPRPGVSAADFRSTVFATGLDFPYGMQALPDGSLLVAVCHPLPSGSYFASLGEMIRLRDSDGDGRADGAPTILYSGLPGVVASVRRSSGLVFVTSAEDGRQRITVLREDVPGAAYALAGAINLDFPPGWEHGSYALAIQPVNGGVELYFNVGSSGNDSQSADRVTASGLVNRQLEGGSIYRVVIRRDARRVKASAVTRIASGLRNAAGIAIEPVSGDLYFEDNGIDDPLRRSDQRSADELDTLARKDLGGRVESFGFPDNYVAYRTGTLVGGRGEKPVCAFQPLGARASESEGAVEIAFPPTAFPTALRSGVFIGFYGEYGKYGVDNGENPVVFCDRSTGSYYHFISNDEPGVAHPMSLLSTRDSLFVADLAANAALDASGAGAGVIYQIRANPPPAGAKTGR